tara:strand:- start:351 stop:500 length:150 start_codon:yes stop_codon:yes gene_type:complete
MVFSDRGRLYSSVNVNIDGRFDHLQIIVSLILGSVAFNISYLHWSLPLM